MSKTLLVAAIVALSCSTPLQAASDNGEFKHHTPGIIFGVTHSDGDNNLSIGLEYEYRINNSWGAGATYERTPQAHDGDGVSVYYLAGYWHPNDHWRFGLGAGKERIHGSHGHTEDLVRVSASYDFHIGEYGVAPTLDLDEVDGEVIEVFGIAISRRF
ncbi:hypothetical protein BST96_03110 [Oceanicoccus sagamiensis]|uniref:Outer membrane protein beta-barrel domain-containing protein n=1 Tax=Oceanicoccus sagamiensis TaxID=716816 RepID=A0A1X9NGY9_9GAMM|nr:hypothetical protein BST96_03110 [Oceanicoccus sagamiensis]